MNSKNILLVILLSCGLLFSCDSSKKNIKKQQVN